MPAHSRAFVRTGLAWLALGMGLGVALALRPLPGGWFVYLHLLTVGWTTNLIFGVALWLFPRQGPPHPYGHPLLAWGIYGALNGGLLLRGVAEPLHLAGHGGPWGVLLALGGGLMVLAGVAFARALWPRVRGR